MTTLVSQLNMLQALIDDLGQRVISGNKLEQRQNLMAWLREIRLVPGAKVLDFGCGTGLFAKTILQSGLSYVGYDIDPKVIAYATQMYRSFMFTTSRQDLEGYAPFQLIVANCCFHHICDAGIEEELAYFCKLLGTGGRFLLIDLLLNDNDPHVLRRLFRKLERGAYVRTMDAYDEIVKKFFDIERRWTARSHVFSLKRNPIYNDLIILDCVPSQA